MTHIEKLKKKEEELTKNIEDKVKDSLVNLTDPEPNNSVKEVVKEPEIEIVKAVSTKEAKTPEPIPSTDYAQKYDELREMFTKQTQAHNTLKGKYNAEVPKSAKEIAKYKRSLEAKELEISKLQENFSNRQQESFEDFDTDYVTPTRVPQAPANSPDLDDFRAELDSVRETQNTINQDSFYARLASSVPDWAVVNADPTWQTWLLNVDPIYQQTYQEMLDYAQGRFNAEGVAKVFNMFKNEAGITNPVPRKTAKRTIEDVIAPESGGGTPSLVGKTAPTYTMKQIKQMRVDCLKLRRENTTESIEASEKLYNKYVKAVMEHKAS